MDTALITGYSDIAEISKSLSINPVKLILYFAHEDLRK